MGAKEGEACWLGQWYEAVGSWLHPTGCRERSPVKVMVQEDDFGRVLQGRCRRQENW